MSLSLKSSRFIVQINLFKNYSHWIGECSLPIPPPKKENSLKKQHKDVNINSHQRHSLTSWLKKNEKRPIDMLLKINQSLKNSHLVSPNFLFQDNCLIFFPIFSYKYKKVYTKWLINRVSDDCKLKTLVVMTAFETYQQKTGWGCPRGVMVKVIDCGIIREFEDQARYYVQFRTNTVGKR